MAKLYCSRVKAPATLDRGGRLAPQGALLKQRIQTLDKDDPLQMTADHQTTKFDLRKTIRVATWNVLTLNGTGYQVALIHELTRLNIMAAGITETHLQESGCMKVEGATVLHSGSDSHSKGVALILQHPLADALKSWQSVSSRLLSARLEHRHGNLSIVVAYAPTEEADVTEKDSFYDQLSSISQAVPPHDEFLILGDMNANSGPRSPGFQHIVGRHGSGQTNDNSLRLLTFCSSQGLMVCGTWFQRRDIHRYTWYSNDGRTKKELDHILSRRLGLIKSYRVFQSAEAPANSDHRMVVAELSLQLSYHRKATTRRSFNTNRLLEEQGLAEQYSVTVQNRFSALGCLQDDVELAWGSFCEVITSSATDVIGFRRPRRLPWLSDEALRVLDKKSEARLRGDKQEQKRLKGVFRAKAKKDRAEFIDKLAAEAENAFRRNDLKPAYRAARRLSSKPRTDYHPAPVFGSDGTLHTSEEEILETWAEHFTRALNHPPVTSNTALDEFANSGIPNTSILSGAPSIEEVELAVSKLRSGKAPGCDGIPPELLKCAIGPVTTALHYLFGLVWSTGKVPAQWKEGIIVSLYKGKGTKSDCGNYRPITLLSVPGKVFAHVLLARLRPLFSLSRRPEQSGFTSGRSTVDAILALRLLTEIHREFDRPLYAAYVDLKAAFDSVDREALWKALQGIGVPPFLLQLIKDLHAGTSAKVRLGTSYSRGFGTSSGVRQGCILAPDLFCCAIDWILRNIAERCGVSIGEVRISDFDYADDVVLVDSAVPNIEEALISFQREAAAFGLNISWRKTKIQNLGTGPDPPHLIIEGQTVESVSSFVYLGSNQDSSGRCLPDVQRRMGLASAAMHRLHNIWHLKKLSTTTKVDLYRSCVLSILLYGSETWTLLKSDLQRLEAFHLCCQRQLLGVRWYDFIPNSVIVEMTGMEPVANYLDRRRLSLFGHVTRLPVTTPAHKVMKCALSLHTGRRPPSGWKRPRGRPRKSWATQIGDGSYSAIRRQWDIALQRDHGEPSLRATAAYAF